MTLGEKAHPLSAVEPMRYAVAEFSQVRSQASLR
jgi:hypothetical protein